MNGHTPNHRCAYRGRPLFAAPARSTIRTPARTQRLPARTHLEVGGGLGLLVLERAVEQDDARVLDAALHARVRDVLLHHHAVQHAAAGTGHENGRRAWKACVDGGRMRCTTCQSKWRCSTHAGLQAEHTDRHRHTTNEQKSRRKQL